MQKYRDNVTIQGRGGLVPVRNANVTVYNHGTNDKAVIYSNATMTPQANPFITDALGGVSFYAENGRYDIAIQGDGQSTRLNDILMQDVLLDVQGLEIDMVAVQGVAASAQASVSAIEDNSSSSQGAALVGFKPAFSGAVGRDVFSKITETVSVKDFGAVGDGVTDDLAAINAAISYCRSASTSLYWPNGVYNCSSWITNMHTIKHTGPGSIKRNDDIFYISPKSDQTNTLYIAPGGFTTSDALSSDRPVRNVEMAINIIKNYPESALSGHWVIKMLPGTYIEGVRIDYFPVTNGFITVEGSRDPDTQEITSIMDGASASRFEALNFIDGTPMLRVDSVRFINWRQGGGVGGGCGVQTRYTGYCEIADCEFDNCDSGVFVYNSRVTLYGGVFTNCDYGFRTSYQSNVTTYRSQRFPGQRPLFSGLAATAVTLSRGSQGHVDYCDFEDCRDGVGIGEGGRAHVMGCDFKRCTRSGVFLTGSSQWLDDPVTVNNFHMGTPDACARIASHEGGSRELRVHGMAYGEVAYRQRSSAQLLPFTGTTDNTIVVFNDGGSNTSFIVRMPPYYLAERNTVKVYLAGTITGAGNKTIRLYAGGTVLATAVTSATGAFSLEFQVTASAFSQQRVTTTFLINGQNPIIQNATTNISLQTSELQINTRVQLADPAANVTIRQYDGWVIG